MWDLRKRKCLYAIRAHENVVRSLGTAKKKDGQMMLIQEFMAGGSLGDQLRRPRYSGLQSLRWIQAQLQKLLASAAIQFRWLSSINCPTCA